MRPNLLILLPPAELLAICKETYNFDLHFRSEYWQRYLLGNRLTTQEPLKSE